MVVVTGSATKSAADTAQEYNVFWLGTSEYFYAFGTTPSLITLHNTSAVQLQVRVMHYRDINHNMGQAAFPVLAPGASIDIQWVATDLNWAGLAMNLWHPPVGTWTIEFSYAETGQVYCIYGTEPKPTTTTAIFISSALITAITAGAALSWTEALLLGFVGEYINSQELCAGLPPPLPPSNIDLWSAPLQTKRPILENLLWLTFCQCKAGASTPIPPPAPVYPQPPGAPAPPTFPCDPADLCGSISQIKQALALLNQQLVPMAEELRLVQRYNRPFAYIRGATHSGLSGSGTISIPRCIGVQVAVTNRPNSLRELTGAPLYVFDLGWVSCLTPDGLIDEVRLSRDVQVWQSRLLPEATVLGYALRENVVVAITELYAEP